MTNLNKLLDEIICKGFPELIKLDISISWVKLNDAFLQTGTFLAHKGYFIEVDHSLKNVNISILIGGLAHELSHVALNHHSSSIIENLLYKLSKHYKTAIERTTDLETIIRGYGNDLLNFIKWSNDAYEQDGLSLRELKILTGNKQ